MNGEDDISDFLQEWKNLPFYNGKPIQSFSNIQDALIPVSSGPFRYKSRRLIDINAKSDSASLLILSSGYAFSYRDDDSCIGVTVAPSVIGIVGAFSNFYQQTELAPKNYYLITGSTCDFYRCAVEEFARCIEQKELWHDIARILASRFLISERNNKILVSGGAHEIIKYLLVELSKYPDYARNQINVQEYIQHKGGLSRSNIMRILSEMRTSNEITLYRGRLISLNPAFF